MLTFVKDPELLEVRLESVEKAAIESEVFAISLNNISDAFQFFKSLLKHAPTKERENKKDNDDLTIQSYFYTVIMDDDVVMKQGK